METKQIITLGKDGKYYNQFGSLAFPNMSNAAIRRWQGIKIDRSFKEFEIQAITYVNLVKYFKGYSRVKGEYVLYESNKLSWYMCDIAILDKNLLKPLIIIEVKRDSSEINPSKAQIDNYYNFCDNVITISSMNEAENIVNTIQKLNIE